MGKSIQSIADKIKKNRKIEMWDHYLLLFISGVELYFLEPY